MYPFSNNISKRTTQNIEAIYLSNRMLDDVKYVYRHTHTHTLVTNRRDIKLRLIYIDRLVFNSLSLLVVAY